MTDNEVRGRVRAICTFWKDNLKTGRVDEFVQALFDAHIEYYEAHGELPKVEIDYTPQGLLYDVLCEVYGDREPVGYTNSNFFYDKMYTFPLRTGLLKAKAGYGNVGYLDASGKFHPSKTPVYIAFKLTGIHEDSEMEGRILCVSTNEANAESAIYEDMHDDPAPDANPNTHWDTLRTNISRIPNACLPENLNFGEKPCKS